jgi:hypothetical protein
MERHLVDLPAQPGSSPYTDAATAAMAGTFTRLGDGETAEAYARQIIALHQAPDVRDTLFEHRIACDPVSAGTGGSPIANL